jgi:hypothetical protein
MTDANEEPSQTLMWAFLTPSTRGSDMLLGQLIFDTVNLSINTRISLLPTRLLRLYRLISTVIFLEKVTDLQVLFASKLKYSVI